MDDLAPVEYIAPLYLKVPELPVVAPSAVECPACFAIVLAVRLADHQRASHG